MSIPTYEEITAELDRLWAEKASGPLSDTSRFDLTETLNAVSVSCERDWREHLGLWVGVFDQAVRVQHGLHAVALATFERADDRDPAFMMLAARGVALMLGIRKLVVSGLHDAAKPVARSLLETLDLALVCLTDEEFATAYIGGDEDSPTANEFWKRFVAYGRINTRLSKTFALAGWSDVEVAEQLERRSEIKRGLSDSVHAASSSAFQSMFTRSARAPDMVGMAVFGHVSAASQFLLSEIVSEVHRSIGAVVGLLTSGTPTPFGDPRDRGSFKRFAAELLTLEAIMQRYESFLPPPPSEWPINETEA